MNFQVGDLITLKHHRGNPDAPAPLAIVVSLSAYCLDRIMIQHRGTSGPEMAAPEHWVVVSRDERK